MASVAQPPPFLKDNLPTDADLGKMSPEDFMKSATSGANQGANSSPSNDELGNMSAEEFMKSAAPASTVQSRWEKAYGAIPYMLGGGDVSNSVLRDSFFQDTAVGRILSATGQGAESGWGSEPLGLSDEQRKELYAHDILHKDGSSPYQQSMRAYNMAFLRPFAEVYDIAAKAADAAMRASNAAVGGASAYYGQAARELGFSETTAEEAEKTVNLAPNLLAEGGLAGPHVPEEAVPLEHPLQALQDAHDLGIIGDGRNVDLVPPELNATTQRIEAQKAKNAEAAPQPAAEVAEPAKAEPQAPQAIDDVARKIDPGTMDQWQALNTRRDTYRQWISDLTQQKTAEAEAKSPFADTIRSLTDQIADTQAKMEDTTPRLAKKYQSRIDDFQSQLEDAQAKHDEYMQTAVTDSGDVARVRQALMKTDYAMRDMAPQISDLYRQAQAQMPGEEAPAAPAHAEAAPEASPVAAGKPVEAAAPQEPAKIAPVPAEAVQAAGEPANTVGKGTLGLPDQRAQIEKDVVDKLTKAGRPADEANAAAALISARYETRAERFGGAKGNALDLYNSEAPEIAAGGNKAKRGTIRLGGDQKPTIRLMQDADASTFMHETGHAWLEELMSDAKADGVHESVKQDAQTVRDWLGASNAPPVKEGMVRFYHGGGSDHLDVSDLKDLWVTPHLDYARNYRTSEGATNHVWYVDLPEGKLDELGARDEVNRYLQHTKVPEEWAKQAKSFDEQPLTRAQHEKFAKSFEQYLFTGQAPLPRLAEVFRQFRDWLSTIYNAATGRGIKISDDIRDVFDRLIAVNPERQPLLTKEPFGKTLADLHEADAEHAPDEMAREIGHNVQEELSRTAEARPPLGEIASGRGEGTGGGASNPEPAGVSEPGNVEPGGGGNAPSRAEVGSRAGNAEAEGAGIRSGAGALEGERGGERPEKASPLALKTEVPSVADANFAAEARPEKYFDKAGNIRLDNLNRPEDIKAVLSRVASDNAGFIEERGGIKSLMDQQAAADALGLKPDNFSPNRPEGVPESTWLRAVKDLTLRSATDVRDAMVRLRDSGSDEDAAAFGKALSRHTMIQGEFSRAKAESGRALAANRWDDAKATVEGAGQMAEEATGMTLNQLKQMARDGAALETPEQVSGYIEQAMKPSMRDKFMFCVTNWLISGLKTHSVYQAATAVMAFERTFIEKPLAAAYGSAAEALGRSPTEAGRVYWQEVAPSVYGMMSGVPKGVYAALQAFKSNMTARLPGEEPTTYSTTGAHQQPIEGTVGNVIGAPGRLVTAMHSFNRTVFYTQRIHELAVREAYNSGLTGDALAQKIGDLTINPTDAMMKDAIDIANRYAYMRKPEYRSVAQKVESLANSNVFTKYAVPFARVSQNIVREAVQERSPVGLLSERVRSNLLGKNGAALADETRAQMTTGVLIGGAMTMLFARGLATGAGPTDPNERRLDNRPPDSVNLDGTWVSYGRLGHLGMLMKMGSGVGESIKEGTDHGIAAGILKLGASFGHAIIDETPMVTISNLMKIIEGRPAKVVDPSTGEESYEPNREARRAAYGIAEEPLPFSSFFRQMANTFDPYQRQTNTFGEDLQNMVPGWRNQLTPRRDTWGQPIPSSTSPILAAMEAPFSSPTPPDPTTQELQRLGVFPAAPSRKFSGVPLSEKQYDDLSVHTGQLMKQLLDQQISAPGWKGTPDAMKINAIRTTIEGARKAGMAAILYQYPQIRQDAVNMKLRKMGALQ